MILNKLGQHADDLHISVTDVRERPTQSLAIVAQLVTHPRSTFLLWAAVRRAGHAGQVWAAHSLYASSRGISQEPALFDGTADQQDSALMDDNGRNNRLTD